MAKARRGGEALLGPDDGMMKEAPVVSSAVRGFVRKALWLEVVFDRIALNQRSGDLGRGSIGKAGRGLKLAQQNRWAKSILQRDDCANL